MKKTLELDMKIRLLKKRLAELEKEMAECWQRYFVEKARDENDR